MCSSCIKRTFLTCLLIAFTLTGCSRDPNVKKQKYFESGESYFAKGKYREAAIQYSNAIQIDSRYAQAYYQLGQTYLKLKDLRHAYEALNHAVELNPDNYPAHQDIANLLVTSHDPNDITQAEPHLKILSDKQPNAPGTYEAWANYYAATNKVGDAITAMQKAINADPNRSESYLNLAILQLRGGLPAPAEASFKKAAELDPKAMNAQLALGVFYQSQNRKQEAERQFHHAIDVDTTDPSPRAALVRLLMADKRFPEIESFLQQTKKDLPDNSEGYRMLGDYYFSQGNLDKAADEYGSLYSDHPKDILVKRNYVQLLILKNRLDDATKINTELLKSNPHDVDAQIYQGQIQIRKGDAAGAVDTLQKAIANDRENAVAHYQLGLAFDLQHNDTRAESEWQAAIQLRPDLVDAHQALALAAIRRNDVDSLTREAEQIIAINNQNAEGYLLRAIAEINRQRYPEAEKDLTTAATLAPDSPAPRVQMGNLYLTQKKFPEAEKAYQEALGKDPQSTDGLSGLMNTYMAEKQPDKAVDAANAQIAKFPNNSIFYDLLGTALYNGKKDLPGAEAALHKAIALDKNNSDAIVKLGKVQAEQGSSDAALATYQQSIKDNPREVSLYLLCGELYESKQNWDQAKAMYQQALNLQPNHPLASNNLAYVMLQQGGNVDVALAMAQTARRGLPESPNVADTLGWAYYQKGVYQSAIDLFQESLRLNQKAGGTEDPSVHYHLGLAYQKSNQPALARQQLERALKINPNNADARKALSDLRG